MELKEAKHIIKKGEVFTKQNIKVIRPGNGLAPVYYKDVIGKVAREDLEKGTPLSLEMVS